MPYETFAFLLRESTLSAAVAFGIILFVHILSLFSGRHGNFTILQFILWFAGIIAIGVIGIYSISKTSSFIFDRNIIDVETDPSQYVIYIYLLPCVAILPTTSIMVIIWWYVIFTGRTEGRGFILAISPFLIGIFTLFISFFIVRFLNSVWLFIIDIGMYSISLIVLLILRIKEGSMLNE